MLATRTDRSIYRRYLPHAVCIWLAACSGVYQSGKVETIENDQNNRTTPSYVIVNVEEQLTDNPAENNIAQSSYKVVNGLNNNPEIAFKWKDVSDMAWSGINAQGKGPRGVDYRPLRSLNPNHDNEL